MLEKLKNRYVILAICFLIFGFIILFQLINLQVIHGKEYEEESKRRLLKEKKIMAPRGNILDRYGVPIATNRESFNIQLVKTEISYDEFNGVILKLINILDKNNDAYNHSFSNYLTFDPITFNNKKASTIKEWLAKYNLIEKKRTSLTEVPEDIFRYLRDEKFKIEKSFSDADAYKIITVRYEILKYQGFFDEGNPLVLAKDVSVETLAEIYEKHHQLTGVLVGVEPVREYIDDAQTLAHVIGYVRGINAEEYEQLKNKGYGSNDIIGKTGIELQAEEYLRGVDGHKTVEVDTSGRQTDDLGGIPAIPGNDVILTLDMNLQRVAMESLERNINDIKESGRGGSNNFGDANAGAVVAIDVNTGEILAMASYPSYNPSIFLAGADDVESQKAITELYNSANQTRPAFNRAIAGTYAPGSTFKLITAIAGLEEGIISPQTIINCYGKTEIGNKDFWCLEYRLGLGAHGSLNLKKALETSCNIYFHELGFRTTIDNIDKWGKYFGLGEYTGIDIRGEERGIRANKENKERLHHDVWRPADTAQTAIGQFDNAFTPLQMANYISILANGGLKYKPYIIKKVTGSDGSVVVENKPVFETVPVSQETIYAVKEGMVAVTQSVEGTASSVFRDFPFKVAGKTGTAETGKESKQSSNALFVCYAPADNPQIAVAVVVEKGVWGSYTAPIARDILEEYFGLNKADSFDDRVELNEAVFTR